MFLKFKFLKKLRYSVISSDLSLSFHTNIDAEHMIMREDDENRKHGW